MNPSAARMSPNTVAWRQPPRASLPQFGRWSAPRQSDNERSSGQNTLNVLGGVDDDASSEPSPTPVGASETAAAAGGDASAGEPNDIVTDAISDETRIAIGRCRTRTVYHRGLEHRHE
jgi:hypothetical protein